MMRDKKVFFFTFLLCVISLQGSIVYRVPMETEGYFMRYTITTPMLQTLPQQIITQFNALMELLEDNQPAMGVMVDFYRNLWRSGDLALYKKYLLSNEVNAYTQMKSTLSAHDLEKVRAFEELIFKSQYRVARIKRWVRMNPVKTLFGIAAAGAGLHTLMSKVAEHRALNKMQKLGLGRRLKYADGRRMLADARRNSLDRHIESGTVPIGPRSSTNGQLTRDGALLPWRIKSARTPGHEVHGVFDELDRHRNVDRALAAWRINVVGPEAWWLSTPEGKNYLQDLSRAIKAVQSLSLEEKRQRLTHLRAQYQQEIARVKKDEWKVVVPKTSLIRSSLVPDGEIDDDHYDDDHYLVLEENLSFRDGDPVSVPWDPHWKLTDKQKDQLAMAAYLSGSTDVHTANVRADLVDKDGNLVEKVAFIDLERFTHDFDSDPETGELQSFDMASHAERLYEKKKTLRDMFAALWVVRSKGQDDYFAQKAGVPEHQQKEIKSKKLRELLLAAKDHQKDYRVDKLLERISNPDDKKLVAKWFADTTAEHLPENVFTAVAKLKLSVS